MVKIAELRAATVIDKQDTKIVSGMTVAEDVHIIEKAEVANHTKTESVSVSQRQSKHRRYPTVNTKASHIGITSHSGWRLKKIP